MRRRSCIVLVMVLMLGLAASVQAANFWDAVGNLQTDIVYASSFRSGENTVALKLAVPVYAGTFKSKRYTVNVDVLGFLDTADLGMGGSVTVERAIGKLNVGVGWLPKDYGISWYVGVKF